MPWAIHLFIVLYTLRADTIKSKFTAYIQIAHGRLHYTTLYKHYSNFPSPLLPLLLPAANCDWITSALVGHRHGEVVSSLAQFVAISSWNLVCFCLLLCMRVWFFNRIFEYISMFLLECDAIDRIIYVLEYTSTTVIP